MNSNELRINDYIDKANHHFLKREYREALQHYRKALALDKDNPVAYYNIANILALQSKFGPAERHYKEALRYKSAFPEALNNLGNVLKEQGRLSDAMMSYEEAIRLKGDYFEAYNGLATVLQAEGRIEEAIGAYKKAIELNPNYFIAYSNLLLALNYSSEIPPEEIFKVHIHLASLIDNQFKHKVKSIDKEEIAIKSRDKIKIGYVSPDFRRHSVGYFILPIIECHDRDRFEVYLYSDVRVKDTVTEQFIKASDHFIDCYDMSDEELYLKIKTDGIQILFDLAGHSAYNRLTVFAMKPSPIQITWIGYPNTTGLKTMDYRIVDNYTDPVGMSEQIHTERLLRMQGCFLCYSPPTQLPVVKESPFKRNGFITFGSLHNLSKINDFTINLWSMAMNIDKDSKIIIKSKNLIDNDLKERLIKRFKERGIDKDRLILMPYVKDYTGHLDVYNFIDISLDCYPYNGTTTTFESLLMGVPVVTLSGSSHVSRVGLSILTNLGMKGFIANTKDEFLTIIDDLSSRTERLSNIRESLRRHLLESSLTNKINFTKTLEKIIEKILSEDC